MERILHTMNALPALIAALLLTLSCFAQTWERESPKQDANASSITGQVIDNLGTPVANAEVSASVVGTGNWTCTAKSGPDGAFSLACPLPGELWVKFEAPGCPTILRKIPAEARKARTLLTINIKFNCSEVPVPLRPHVKSPGVPPATYVGWYRMVTTDHDGQKRETTIFLSGDSESPEHKCRCGTWNLVLSAAGEGARDKGCWRVKEDGDLEVKTPCGLVFAGESWTLWRDGALVVGQGSSWSDAGGGSYWDIQLVPVKTAPAP